jgi:hypothetical protein
MVSKTEGRPPARSTGRVTSVLHAMAGHATHLSPSLSIIDDSPSLEGSCAAGQPRGIFVFLFFSRVRVVTHLTPTLLTVHVTVSSVGWDAAGPTARRSRVRCFGAR